MKKWKSLKRFDKVTYIFTYLASGFTVFILAAILIFTLVNGAGLISFNLLTGDYNASTHTIKVDSNDYNVSYNGKLPDDTYYSATWGIALTDSTDTEGKACIVISIVADDSPMNEGYNSTGDVIGVKTNTQIASYIDTDYGTAYTRYGAEEMIRVLNNSTIITNFSYSTTGGGIRGSIISTVYLIVLTLIIVVPFGIFASIYINEYAKKNKFLRVLQSMIDMLSGVPSIIYGLMGAAVFIPFVNNLTNTEGSSGSLYAGALTMSVILLPVIIKTTIEGLKTVPQDLRSASLALGASETQTTFKVVLPNAIGSISTGVILAIGRIVGESAALIFVIGTLISDNIDPSKSSTTLAVHIWSVMAGEVPNFELASSIALIILVFVLGINFLVKFLSKKFNKFNV